MGETKLSGWRLSWMLIFLACLQAVTAAPDIQFHAEVRARSVTVDQNGTTRLSVHAEPDGGSVVHVTAPPAQRTLRHVTITVDAAARIRPDATNDASPQGDNE